MPTIEVPYSFCSRGGESRPIFPSYPSFTHVLLPHEPPHGNGKPRPLLLSSASKSHHASARSRASHPSLRASHARMYCILYHSLPENGIARNGTKTKSRRQQRLVPLQGGSRLCSLLGDMCTCRGYSPSLSRLITVGITTLRASCLGALVKSLPLSNTVL